MFGSECQAWDLQNKLAYANSWTFAKIFSIQLHLCGVVPLFKEQLKTLDHC